jgi:hypothetical protein
VLPGASSSYYSFHDNIAIHLLLNNVATMTERGTTTIASGQNALNSLIEGFAEKIRTGMKPKLDFISSIGSSSNV